MIREFINENELASSAGIGYSMYFLITQVGDYTQEDVTLILVLTVLVYVYFKSDVFGGYGGLEE